MSEPRIDPDNDEGHTPLYPHLWDQAEMALQMMNDWVGWKTEILSAVERFSAGGSMTIRVDGANAQALAEHLRGREGVASAVARPTKSGWRVMVDFGSR